MREFIANADINDISLYYKFKMLVTCDVNPFTGFSDLKVGFY